MRQGAAIAAMLGLLFVNGCRSSRISTHISSNSSPGQAGVEGPQANWEPIHFRQIDELTKIANLPPLRSSILSSGDLEARFWFEAGSFGMDGIVVRKSNGEWSGTYIRGFSRDPNFKKYSKLMKAPRSGWEAAWQRLVDAGLLTMPNASQVRCNVNGKDGAGFVFETNVNKAYRMYSYDNPAFAECEQAKEMLKLIGIINEEFGVQWPTTK